MSVIKYMSIMTTLSVFAALFSIIYKAFLSLKQLNKLTTILTGLLALERINHSEPIDKPKIAVGYGSCMDIIISATNVLNFSDIALQIDYENYSIDDISNETELIQSFSYYFRNGAAAERFVSDEKLFKGLINTIQQKHKDSIMWSVGGNAPIMSKRFIMEGADEVLLAAHTSPKLRELLPHDIKIAGDLVDNDDIHLILEYKAGEKWGPFTAPRANRYILHNDQNNPKVNSLESFDKVLKNFNPRLLVVSGLQMMDSHKFVKGVRESRIEKIKNQISSQSLSTLIHFEMASYVELDLIKLLIKHILPYSDSIGMNEQELDNLQQVLEFGKIKFASDSNPRVAIALDQMRKIFNHINRDYIENPSKMKRMLTRIHVHTLAYQAILIVKNSQWNYTKNAAAKAALTSHRYVCQNENINPESSVLILDESFSTSLNNDDDSLIENDIPKRINLEPTSPVSCWNESMRISTQVIDYEICIAPVLVCRTAKVTAGAGDNISASGLILQI